MRVMLLGATGSIGRAVARALVAAGHETVCPVRTPKAVPDGAEARQTDVTDSAALARDGFRGERFDALISCLASRSGAPEDAWAIDHEAHIGALQAAQDHGVRHMVLLSAICVQKPSLAFQFAKLAFEEALQASPLTWSIVRPTAYFKSLSGQVLRARDAKPFLVIGDGTMTATKPISDRDLADYMVGCLDDPSRQNRVLPIGGPGPAITPMDQVAMLERLLDREVRVRRVPAGFLGAIAGGLGIAGRVSGRLRAKADLARIGQYYATESMLVWDAQRGRYDRDATPEWGSDRLEDYYRALLSGEIDDDRGEHSVF